MRILVTGASGYLGRHLVPALHASGHTVIAAGHADADLRRPEDARRLVETTRPEVVIHLAWEATPGVYWTSPDNAEWADGTAALAEANAGLQHMILERERAQVVLRQSEARFRSLVLNGSDVIAIIDSAGILSYASPSSMRVLGYSPEKCLHRCVFDVIHPEDLSQSIETLCQAGAESTLQAPHELRIQHANGSWCYVEVSATNLLDDPSVKGIVLNLHDITQRKRLEDQLVRQAFYDALTGLPNRVLVRDRLNHAIKRFQRSPFRLAVAYIDLDNFKTINDSLGHGVGDQLLQAVARRLVEGVRSSDTVARLGGDEFLVLLEDIGTDAEMNRVIERLNERLQAPLQLDRHELIVTASIGIALCCPDSTSDLLVRNADLAMYAAKAKGRSRYEIFHPQMNERARDRLELETDLRRAIRDDELRVVYQPVVVLPTGRMQGVEALVRWEHPRRGMIGPGEFIPLAEQTGLIIPLGLWVLNQSCRQAKAWQELCPDRPLQVSVNLSARQFSQAGLAESVASILHATQLDPALLKLEITESAAMEDGESAIAVMNELCQLGVQLAIDDFGTGYSSFSYLKRFPVNTLKIDRSFVDKLDQASEDRIIARAIIALAHALGLEVTGEGIETLEQRQILLEMGCELGQGYYFSRPTTPAAISAMLIEMDDVVAPPIRQSA